MCDIAWPTGPASYSRARTHVAPPRQIYFARRGDIPLTLNVRTTAIALAVVAYVEGSAARKHRRSNPLLAVRGSCCRLATKLEAPLQTSAKLEDRPLLDESKQCKCEWCGQDFPSRTQMFRHLRSSLACLAASESSNPAGAATLAVGGHAKCVAFAVGYFFDGERAEQIVRDVLAGVGARPVSTVDGDVEVSRGTGDKSRGRQGGAGYGDPILRQERSCGAAFDVITARFLAAAEGRALLTKLCASIRQQNLKQLAVGVQILDVRLLEKGVTVHAEASCTQRVYNYVLPASAVDPSFRDKPEESESSLDAPDVQNFMQPPVGQLKQCLTELKSTLRSMMQSLVDGESPTRVQRFAGAKMYGSESRRLYRWHNFAPAELAGSLSPQRDSVLAALDRFAHFRAVSIGGQVFLILQLSGDSFLVEQCRRLVATLVCIHRGWLPKDFLRIALRPDVVIKTPIAPGGLLYLSACRFATWSRYHGRLFDRSWVSRTVQPEDAKVGPWFPEGDDVLGAEPAALRKEWLDSLLQHIALGAEPSADWLHDLEHSVAPRIREELAVVARLDDFASLQGGLSAPLTPGARQADACPEAYREVLRLLQEARASGRWPATSPARSRVVRCGEGGTFSVGRVRPGQRAPAGNETFPALTEAVFALEEAICPRGREPSTMVAINFNAMFSPHTDSGAGSGQSKSLIVGLGSYEGGELAVEGIVHEIQYKPLEFDGWRQRHWTFPYTGERFSLVWFSPA